MKTDFLSAVFDDVKMCNCAECGRELIAPLESQTARREAELLLEAFPLVSGRIKGRPYCDVCLAPDRSRQTGSYQYVDGYRVSLAV